MKKKISFTCGFAINKSRSDIVLIRKKRGPVGMTGFWNGVGGKMECGEGARGAQSREFNEETGVMIDVTRWATFHYERKVLVPEIEPSIFFMLAVLDDSEMQSIRTVTDEEVKVWKTAEAVKSLQVFHNLPWLILMALDYHRYPTEQWIEG